MPFSEYPDGHPPFFGISAGAGKAARVLVVTKTAATKRSDFIIFSMFNDDPKSVRQFVIFCREQTTAEPWVHVL